MDCASIIFGVIRHHKHNFHLFSNFLFLFTKLSFIDRATNVSGRTSVLQANLSNKINVFSSHSWNLGPTGSDTGLFPQESTHVNNYLGYPRWRPIAGC